MAGSAPVRSASIARRDARDRLIVALDVGSVAEAEAIVRELDDEVSFYKVGWHLLLDRELHNLLGLLKTREKRIFLDCKTFDIPATVEGAVRAAAALGVKFITVPGQREIVTAAVRARGSSPLQILVVTLLTYINQENFNEEYGSSENINEFILRRAKFAANNGCDGVISSAMEVKLIKGAIDRDDFVIVTPGIRPRDAAPDDQKRVVTPYDAITNGSDYLVIGRPIIHSSQSRRDAARAILAEMQSALDVQDEMPGQRARMPLRWHA